MHLTVQFPIADLRRFHDDDTGLLPRPNWPVGMPHRDFVRGFGGIIGRALGGVDGWIGEDVLCDAAHLVSMGRVITDTQAGRNHKVAQARCRFYADGHAVARFDLGLTISKLSNGGGIDREELFGFSGRGIGDYVGPTAHLDAMLRHRLRIAGAASAPTPLIAAGTRLAERYRSSSTRQGHKSSVPDRNLVIAANPIAFIECDRGQAEVIHLSGKMRVIKSGLGRLYHGRSLIEGVPTRIWAFHDDHSRPDLARVVRIALLRIHTEQEVLRSVLTFISDGTISPRRRGEASQRLQYYLNRAVTRLNDIRGSALWTNAELPVGGRGRDVFIRPGTDGLAGWVKEVEDMAIPAQRVSLVESLVYRLRLLDVRGNLIRKVKRYATGAGCRITVDRSTGEISLDGKVLPKRCSANACEVLAKLIKAAGVMRSPSLLLDEDPSLNTPHKDRVRDVVKQLPAEIRALIISKKSIGKALNTSAFRPA